MVFLAVLADHARERIRRIVFESISVAVGEPCGRGAAGIR
jgi:hypothetical protein